MEDYQLAALIERVLHRISEEAAAAPARPKAYLIFPEDWQARDQGPCTEVLRALRGAYDITAILPDTGSQSEFVSDAGACAALRRGEAGFPEEDFLTVFPFASRNLVVKTALCLVDDFETRWVARCLAQGCPVVMRREHPLFTGRERDAYKQKIENYYRDAASYGIQFELPSGCGATHRPPEARVPDRKRIVTQKDLETPGTPGTLLLRRGDIVTALAAERAGELGIDIVVQGPQPFLSQPR
ncbi:MAG: hypothetical protein LBC26_05450 [Oscillospiraceae bacterium]|nr:hypothetical protein [Oscillospiraceae bacterium]